MEITSDMGVTPGTGAKYWILGLKGDTGIVDREEADIISWAWRSLYAVVVESHSEKIGLNYEKALLYFTQYLYSRTTAYGYRWRRWYLGQRMGNKSKMFPTRFRDKKLVKLDAFANWKLNKNIIKWYKRVRDWHNTD